MKRKEYESPQTLIAEVEAEGCFCGSVFKPEEEETGVSISGHEIGNSADYSIGSDGKQNDNWDSDTFNY